MSCGVSVHISASMNETENYLFIYLFIFHSSHFQQENTFIVKSRGEKKNLIFG